MSNADMADLNFDKKKKKKKTIKLDDEMDSLELRKSKFSFFKLKHNILNLRNGR